MGINWCYSIEPHIREDMCKSGFASTWIKNRLKGEKDIYIWGCGHDGDLCRNYLYNAGIKIAGFFDNKEEKRTFCNKPVFFSSELSSKSGTCFVASSAYENVISLQIVDMGWSGSIYIFSNLLTELILAWLSFDKNREKLISGIFLYYGNYNNWKDAESSAKNLGYGYEENSILLHAACMAEKAKSNGITGSSVDTWLLSFLFRVKAREGNVDLIDFGGALGDCCFQYRDFVSCERWHIVEQKHFVEYGLIHFPNLEFHNDILFCLNHDPHINSVLFLSSLQYVQNPYEILELVVRRRISHIAIERAPFGEVTEDVITLQTVPSAYGYDGRYPSWIFNKRKMLRFFYNNGYEVVMHQECKAIYPVIECKDVHMVKIEGFMLECKE